MQFPKSHIFQEQVTKLAKVRKNLENKLPKTPIRSELQIYQIPHQITKNQPDQSLNNLDRKKNFPDLKKRYEPRPNKPKTLPKTSRIAPG